MGDIDAPSTIKGLAMYILKGSTIIKVSSENFKISTKKFSLELFIADILTQTKK